MYGGESGTLGRRGDGALECMEPLEFSSVPVAAINVIRTIITEMRVVLSFSGENLDTCLYLDASTLLSVCLYFLAFIFPLLGCRKFWVPCLPCGGHHESSMAEGGCYCPTFWLGSSSVSPHSCRVVATLVNVRSMFGARKVGEAKHRKGHISQVFKIVFICRNNIKFYRTPPSRPTYISLRKKVPHGDPCGNVAGSRRQMKVGADTNRTHTNIKSPLGFT